MEWSGVQWSVGGVEWSGVECSVVYSNMRVRYAQFFNMTQCRLARLVDGVTGLLNDAFAEAQSELAKTYQYSPRVQGEDCGLEVMSNTCMPHPNLHIHNPRSSLMASCHLCGTHCAARNTTIVVSLVRCMLTLTLGLTLALTLALTLPLTLL